MLHHGAHQLFDRLEGRPLRADEEAEAVTVDGHEDGVVVDPRRDRALESHGLDQAPGEPGGVLRLLVDVHVLRLGVPVHLRLRSIFPARTFRPLA